MIDWISWALEYRWVAGLVTGTAAAFAVDLIEFRKWKKWEDAKVYDWSVASFRWAQGAFFGALSGLGLAGLF